MDCFLCVHHCHRLWGSRWARPAMWLSKRWLKCGGRDGQAQVPMEVACHRVNSQSSAWDRSIRRFPKASAVAKNLVFKMLDDGMDLTLRQRGQKEVMWAEWLQIWQISAADDRFSLECVDTHAYQELLRQHKVPWVQETYPDGKYVFRRIQCRPTLPGAPSGCWLNSELQQIRCYICWTWTCWTLLSDVFWRRKSRVQMTSHANLDALCSSIAVEWDWLGQNTSAKFFTHSATTTKPSLRKLKFTFNRWTANAKHKPITTFQTYHKLQ